MQTDSDDYSKAQIQMLKIYDKIQEGKTITEVEKALAMKAVECYCDLNFLDERKALSQADSLKVG